MGQAFLPVPQVCPNWKKLLPRERPLERWRARTPQLIALRMTMSLRVRKPIRMPGTNVTVAVAIRRRGLRQPRRITDRAERD